jgi:hypothetical protein
MLLGSGVQTRAHPLGAAKNGLYFADYELRSVDEPLIGLGYKFTKSLKPLDYQSSVLNPPRSTRDEENSISANSFGYLAAKAVNSQFPNHHRTWLISAGHQGREIVSFGEACEDWKPRSNVLRLGRRRNFIVPGKRDSKRRLSL